MSTPDWIKPGALCKTRDGRKARIYATDCGGIRPIHGSVLAGDSSPEIWLGFDWTDSGTRSLNPEKKDPDDLIGPWVEPEKPKRWVAWLKFKHPTTVTVEFHIDGDIGIGIGIMAASRAPWLDPPEGWSP